MSTVPRLFRCVVDSDAFARLEDDVMSLVGVAVGRELRDVDRRTLAVHQVRHRVGDAKVVVVFGRNDVRHRDSKIIFAIGKIQNGDKEWESEE